jgi:hypothetical protein
MRILALDSGKFSQGAGTFCQIVPFHQLAAPAAALLRLPRFVLLQPSHTSGGRVASRVSSVRRALHMALSLGFSRRVMSGRRITSSGTRK